MIFAAADCNRVENPAVKLQVPSSVKDAELQQKKKKKNDSS